MEYKHLTAALYILLIFPFTVISSEPPLLKFESEEPLVFEDGKALAAFFSQKRSGLMMSYEVSETTPTEVAVAVSFALDSDSGFNIVTGMNKLRAGKYHPKDIFDKEWWSNMGELSEKMDAGEYEMTVSVIVPKGQSEAYSRPADTAHGSRLVARPADTAHGSRLIEKYDIIFSTETTVFLRKRPGRLGPI